MDHRPQLLVMRLSPSLERLEDVVDTLGEVDVDTLEAVAVHTLGEVAVDTLEVVAMHTLEEVAVDNLEEVTVHTLD